VSDPLPQLLERRAQLIREFADALLAIDVEIGVAMRHNVQSQAAAMTTGPYQQLERRVAALETNAAAPRETGPGVGATDDGR
jgi:hypothetical protein